MFYASQLESCPWMAFDKEEGPPMKSQLVDGRG